MGLYFAWMRLYRLGVTVGNRQDAKIRILNIYVCDDLGTHYHLKRLLSVSLAILATWRLVSVLALLLALRRDVCPQLFLLLTQLRRELFAEIVGLENLTNL